MIFFLVSATAYAALTAWLAIRLQATTQEWTFTLGHLLLAAVLNVYLLRVLRARPLCLFAAPPAAFLLVSQVYFTVNGLKYFSPILYPQFDLTLAVQFLGSVAGAVVLFGCAFLLRFQQGPTSPRVFAWVDRYWADLRRLMVVSVAGSLSCKAALVSLGYGSTYTDTVYSEQAVRRYGDFFLLFGNEAFGLLSLLLGMLYLLRPGVPGRTRPFTWVVAVVGVLAQVGFNLLYLRARSILLVTFVILALAAEIRSRRLAERLFQLMLISLPALSLLGVQLTLLLGRVNVPQEAGMRLAIAAVNRRADLTDFATAIMVQSHGEAHDAGIITAAALNAIPRMVFPDKFKVVKDVYSDILDKHLGWPASINQEMVADYQDSAFSAGVMSFGIIGFFLVPLALIWGLCLLSRWLEHSFRRVGYGLTLIALTLAALRIEVEWATIPLSLRQAISIAVVCYLLVLAGRMVHSMLLIASRAPGSATGTASG